MPADVRPVQERFSYAFFILCRIFAKQEDTHWLSSSQHASCRTERLSLFYCRHQTAEVWPRSRGNLHPPCGGSLSTLALILCRFPAGYGMVQRIPIRTMVRFVRGAVFFSGLYFGPTGCALTARRTRVRTPSAVFPPPISSAVFVQEYPRMNFRIRA